MLLKYVLCSGGKLFGSVLLWRRRTIVNTCTINLKSWFCTFTISHPIILLQLQAESSCSSFKHSSCSAIFIVHSATDPLHFEKIPPLECFTDKSDSNANTAHGKEIGVKFLTFCLVQRNLFSLTIWSMYYCICWVNSPECLWWSKSETLLVVAK